jgi:hypothetical protein
MSFGVDLERHTVEAVDDLYEWDAAVAPRCMDAEFSVDARSPLLGQLATFGHCHFVAGVSVRRRPRERRGSGVPIRALSSEL